MLLHGIDIINLKRSEFKNKNLYKKVLHKYEYENYLNNSAEYKHIILAKSWALKEALYKALPVKITMNQMFIEKIDEKYYYEHDSYNFSISISYTDDLIIASAIGIKKYV